MHPNDELVLVTHGSAPVGQAVSRKLSQRYRVVSLDLRKPRHPFPSVDYIPMDLNSDASVRNALRLVRAQYGERVASVVNLAELEGPDQARTRRLLRELRRFQVERLIFARPLVARSDHAVEEDSGIPWCLLRIAETYDDRCRSETLARLVETGDERPARDQRFVHVDDLVEAFFLSVTRRGLLPARLALPISEPEDLDGREVIDISQARNLLTWAPGHRVRSELPKMTGAYRRDPRRWRLENRRERPAPLARRARQALPALALTATGIGAALLLRSSPKLRRSLVRELRSRKAG